MIQTVQNPINNGCLLTYSFDTYPTPLQVSPEGDKRQHGIITVVVSNPDTQPVYCEQIKLTLPVGNGPSHITETPDTISAFVYTNNTAKAWEVQNDKNGVLTATPQAGASKEITSSDSLVFYIYYIQVNKKTGTFPLNIAEATSTTNANFTPKTYTQDFHKFSHGFFCKDLAVYKEVQQEGNTVLIPITELDNSGNGERITLAWNGASNATYTLFYPEQPAGVQIPEGQKSWTSTEPIRDTTTFLLQATTGQGEEQVTAHLSTTVVVNKPDIQAKSLNVTGKVQENGNDLLPKGSIIMWSGSMDKIPNGWALCNGNNGTPNLLNRFIVGAGAAYSVGSTGGAEQVTLTQAQMPIHSHAGETNSDGAHDHEVYIKYKGHVQGSGSAAAIQSPSSSTSTYTYTAGPAGSEHKHIFTTSNTGGGQAHENRPPYYALCFIIKL